MKSQDRAVLDAVLRTDFPAFVRRSFLALNPGATFLPNWHIEAICHHLELVRTGKIRRLIVNVPPRSLKSTICSVAFPAFVLGNEPTRRIITASYAFELAIKFANDNRAIMQSDWYQRLFPGTRISRIKNTEAEIATTLHGGRLATSVGGTLTGRGGDLVIVDDPLKPQDAYSDSKRENVNAWFDNTLLPRLDDKRTGCIVVVMQRVHPDDLTGKLMRLADNWTLLSLPAIAERDEDIPLGPDESHHRSVDDLLHPEREPLSVINEMRAQLGSETFAAQYQQCPLAPDGNMIKRGWIRRYDVLPARTSSPFVLQSYDTAMKLGEENDWTVCTTWYVVDGKYYLADVLRARLDYPTLKARALEHAQLHRPSLILVEDSGLGAALASDLNDRSFTARAVKVEHDKHTRMAIQSAKFESGRVYFPWLSSWLADLEFELFAFPNSRHDDQVDSISQALAYQIQNSFWDARNLEGLNRFTGSLAWDQAFGRLAGRPW